MQLKSNRTQALDAKEQMEQVRDMHESILGNIEHVQEQTARILAEQERDLLRAFRARLFDVQTELEKEKTRAQEGSSVGSFAAATCGHGLAHSLVRLAFVSNGLSATGSWRRSWTGPRRWQTALTATTKPTSAKTRG